MHTADLVSCDLTRQVVFEFDRRCFRSVARIWWEHRAGSDRVRHHVLDTYSCYLTEAFDPQRLR